MMTSISVSDVYTVKIHTDTALFKASNYFNNSMVAWNHTSELVEAISRYKPGNIVPDIAEAIGIYETLNWIKKKNCKEVKIEKDCRVAV